MVRFPHSTATASQPITNATIANQFGSAIADASQHTHATANPSTRRMGPRSGAVIARYSSAATAATAAASRRNQNTGRNRIAASAAAARTTPLITRVMNGSFRADRRRRRRNPAVAPLALLECEHRFEQVTTPEVRPERFGHIDLGVGNLPEEVVADAHFTAGADQQIRIRLSCGVEKTGETLFVEIVGADARLHGPPGRIHDLRTAAVIEGDVEEHAGVAGSPIDGGL